MKVTIAPKKGQLPTGFTCEGDCRKTIKEGQVVVWKSITNVGHFVWHKSCLQKTLDEAPVDLERSIEEEFKSLQMKAKEGITEWQL